MSDAAVNIAEFTKTFEGIVGPEAYMKHMRPAMDDALSVIESRILSKAPDGAKGTLRRSITHDVVITPDQVNGSVFVQPDSDAYQYAYYVEHGRAAGVMPPWGPGTSLFAWTTRKITSAHFASTGKTLRKSPSRDQMIKSISYLIARKISKTGTKAQHFFEDGFSEALPEANRIIDEAFDNLQV